MINYEWLRTFRSVYITKSLSKASEQLMISQPTVSQHISALEARIGKKLFERKSKGVMETDVGRMLNTMIASSIEGLQGVEYEITKRDSAFKSIISIGISEHLYKTILCPRVLDLGEFVHIKFGTRAALIEEVSRGDLNYAVIPGDNNTFDVTCYDLFPQRLLLIGTPDIDLSEIEQLYQQDYKKAERWLEKHKWYSHDINSSFIKTYWLNVFNKKRPSIVPNYIIPNEYEVLFRQSQGSGLSVAFDTTVAPFVHNQQLNFCQLKPVVRRNLSLIANKRKEDPKMTAALLEKLMQTEKYKRLGKKKVIA